MENEELLQRYHDIKKTLANYQARLVAVSKKQDNLAIQTLYNAGHRDFGESYLQEWQGKRDKLPGDIRWHFIGNLQSRKLPVILKENAYSVHSVGSISVLKKLEKMENFSPPEGKIFAQLNLYDEQQKGGFSLKEFSSLYDSGRCNFFAGLMTIPPFDLNEGEIKNHFRDMYKLKVRFRMPFLSMGMSKDWRVALEEGATHIRVGSSLFGPRSIG